LTKTLIIVEGPTDKGFIEGIAENYKNHAKFTP